MSSLRRLQVSDYEIGLPEGWVDGSQIILLGPEHPRFRANIQVSREPLPTTPLEELLAEQRRQLATLPGFKLLGHGERVLGGTPALHHSYAWDMPDNGLRLRQMQITCRNGEEIFTVTASALESDWDTYDGLFELALSAFAWR